MEKLFYLITFFLLISSCTLELKSKYYEEIHGLWQRKMHEDSSYTYPGCSEFFEDRRCREHHGCTVAEGVYWFDEDTLYRTVTNYTNYEEYDTSKSIIIQLSQGKMILYNLLFEDAVYYKKINKDDKLSCFPF